MLSYNMIKEFLDKASDLYHAGTPIISDEEYDSLADMYEHEKLGASAPNGLQHPFPMWSLQKVHPGEEVPEFKSPVESPKLDGAAVAALYVGGQLYRVCTRGDGKRGFDITKNVRHLFPAEIKHTNLIQVCGEIVAPKEIPNARNYAAGALNLKDPEEAKTRELYFIAYEMHGLLSCYTYIANITYLKECGFATVKDSGLTDKFPTDGKVFRENSYKEYLALGFTAKHPRGAYAHKPKPQSVVTTLLDVVWQLGRTGVVSPVAILEPVLVGEAEVSRATLHNMEYINALNLEIGCQVELVRAGEIIPRIVRRVDE